VSSRVLRVFTLVFIVVLVGAGCSSKDASTDATSGAGAPPVAVGDWKPEYVDGVLQPLPDGFPNQPITFVVADLPGSSDGVYARHMQAAVRDVSPVSVEVFDRGDQGSYPTWEAVQWTLDQKGGDQGYYPMIYVVPGLTIDTLTVDLKSELGMSLDDLHFIDATETTPFVMTSRVGAPWGKSFAELVKYMKAGNNVTYISRSPGSTGYIAMERLQKLNGIKFDQRVGGSHDENQAALGAGEIDVSMTQVTNALTHYQAGAIEILLVTGNDRVGEPWQDVPSFADAGMADEPWTQNRGWLVPAKVPDLHSAWLAELFRAGTANKEFQAARMTLPGMILMDPVLGTADVNQLVDQAIKAAEPVIRDLGLAWDQ
jgi:tripartite-type tricarboxylate transporter receptor subunit TctC